MYSVKTAAKSSSKTILIVLFIFCAASYNLWRGWMGSKHPFGSDVSSYYSYLDAAFMHNDLTFSFPNYHWLVKTNEGKFVPKMSMGLALVYLPGFMVCHTVNVLSGNTIDVYNDTYSYGMYYYAILVVFLGLFVLRKVLLKWYSEKVTAFVLLAVFAGTNLFYYTMSFNLMPHSFLFTLNVCLIALTIRLYEQQTILTIIGIGLLLGLITLIRPTGALVSVFVFLYGCHNWHDIKVRFLWWMNNWVSVAFIALLILTVWSPQLFYWKMQSGAYFFYSYGEEGFNFLKPQLINVFFSFRKGWLIYTPIMGLSLIGFYFLYKQKSPFFISTLSLVLLAFYVLSCWWCWSWGGSFGIRAFIDYYPYLAFPLAAFFKQTIEHFKSNTIVALTSFLVAFNLLQTYQYIAVVIHWDNMTKEAYWFSLGKLKYTEEERKYFNTLLEVHSDEVPEEYKNK